MSPEKLPKFQNPPVVEMVLGVQFDLLAGFGNAHLGAFWQSLGEDWRKVIDAPSIEPQFERFGEATRWRPAGVQLKFSQELHTRLQIRNVAADRMIQVQNGRLHYNWMGLGGGQYPQYDTVRPEFDRAVGKFCQFLASESLGEWQPNQWEVTYLNHIPKGTVWETPEEWVQLFPSLAVLPFRPSGVRLESLGGEWHYEIEPQQGRLHVNVSHGRVKRPGQDKDDSTQEMIILNLTARGPLPVGSDDKPDLDAGLRIGHETIVRAFKDLTSEKAHEYWGLIDE